MSDSELFADRMLSLGLARVSEAAVIAAAQLIGRGDDKSAAVDAMRTQINLLDIVGTDVIGEGERDEAPMLYIVEQIGMGPRGSMHHAPDVSMETVAVGPACAPGRVHLALSAANVLVAEGTSPGVLNFSTINPLDNEAVLGAAETGAIVSVEAASVRGGLGGAGAEFLATLHPVPMEIMGFPEFLPTGSAAWRFDHFGLTAQGIAASGRRAFAREAQ